MTSNRPPQLHLELPASTTSFKRSFEQFGFDLDSPLADAGGSGSDGNDRNKRARSAGSFSDDEGSIGSSSSSTIVSSSSSSSSELRAPSALTATRPATSLHAPILQLSGSRAPTQPPRLPTPELQDIDMMDYPLVVRPQELQERPSTDLTASIVPPVPSQHDENYRLSLERFNAFDSQIAALRRSPSPPRLRSPTPPPVLPPLTLLEDLRPQAVTNTAHLPSPDHPPQLQLVGLFTDLHSSRPHSGSSQGTNTDLRNTHDAHVQAEASTPARVPNLNPMTRAPGSSHPSWILWPPAIEGENRDDAFEDGEEGDREDNDDDEEEVQEEAIFYRRASPVPVIEELRPPSPLFEDMEDMEDISRPSRSVVLPTPPTLPPIEGSWNEPLDGIHNYPLHSDSESTAVVTQVPFNAQLPVIEPSHPDWETNDPHLTSRWNIPSAPATHTPQATGMDAPVPPPSGNTNPGANRMTRLEALQSLTVTLHGIGRILQEGERSLESQSFHAPASSNTNSNTPVDQHYLGSVWRSGFAEGFASALSDAGGAEMNETTDNVPRPRHSGPAPSLDSPVRPVLSQRFSSDRPPSPPARLGQLAEEYMNIVRRDNDLQSRPFTQGAADSRDRLGDGRRSHRVWTSEEASRLQPLIVDDRGPGSSTGAGLRARGDAQISTSSHVPGVPSAPSFDSSRRWSWEAMGSEGPLAPAQLASTTPQSGPALSGLLPVFPRRPRIHSHANSLTDLPPLNVLSNATIVSDASSRPSTRPAETGHASRPTSVNPQAQFPSLAPTSTALTSSGPPARLFPHTGIQREPPSHSPIGPRPTATESAFEARRRAMRLELFDRRSRGPPGRDVQENASHSSQSRPWESQSRFPSASSSTAPRFLPELHRSSPVRLAFPRREQESSLSRRSALLGFALGDEPSHELAMDVDRDHRSRGLSSSSTDSLLGALDNSRMDRALDPDHFSGPQAPPLRWHSSLLRRRPASIITREGTVDNLHPVHQDATRSVPGIHSTLSENALGNYLTSPLPSPSLGDIGFGLDEPERQRRSRFGRSSSPGRMFRGLLNRRRSPSPPTQHEINTRAFPRRPSPQSTAPNNLAGSAMDPNAYQPGPFRNTVQRFHDNYIAIHTRTNALHQQPARVPSPPPPVIPPLAFENDLSTLYDSNQATSQANNAYPRRRQGPQHVRSRTFRPLGDNMASDNSDEDTTLPGLHRLNQTARPNSDIPPGPSRRMLHHLSGMTRFQESMLEAPRTANDASNRASESETDNNIQRIPYDRLNLHRTQEIVNRARRERERSNVERRNPFPSSTTTSRPWGYIERRGPALDLLPWETQDHDVSFEIFSQLEEGIDDPDDGEVFLAVRDAERARVIASQRMRRPRRDIAFSITSSDMMRAISRRTRALGDYVRDEDFDASYEGLLSLASRIGEAKPRSTPAHVISKMPTGHYKDWKTQESDLRCPICLDDYQPNDLLLKMEDCGHWLHAECLKQWLSGASTCPVCRKVVHSGSRSHDANEPGPSQRRDPPGHDQGPPGARLISLGRSGGGEWLPPPWRSGQ